MNSKIEEQLYLIAEREPPGDRWKLTHQFKDTTIYPSLTETLNAWFLKTKEKAEFRLAPLDGKLYVIREEEVETEIKTFDIYGESY